MYCDNCGSEITENMKFCRSCGVKIEAFDAVKQPVDMQELAKAAFKNDPNVEDVKIIAEPAKPEEPADKKYKSTAVFKISLFGLILGIMLILLGKEDKGAVFTVGISVIGICVFLFLISGIMLAARYDKRRENEQSQKAQKLYEELEHKAENKTHMFICAAATAGAAVLTFVNAYPVATVKFSLFSLVKYGIGLGTKEIAGIPLAGKSTLYISIVAGLIMLWMIYSAISMLFDVFKLDPSAENYVQKIHSFWDKAIYSLGLSAVMLIFGPMIIINSFKDYHWAIGFVDKLTFKEPDSMMIYYGLFAFVLCIFAIIKDRKYKKAFGI